MSEVVDIVKGFLVFLAILQIFEMGFKISTISTSTYIRSKFDQQVRNNKLNVTGLILARAGSKGLPGKNMINLLGHPLIYWSIDAMVQSSVFDQIWISTDDPKVREYVLQLDLGLKVHDRQKYTATDEATSIMAVQEFLSFNSDIEILALVQCTSPLIQPEFLMKAASQILSSNEIDSVFSVSRWHHFRWSSYENENYYTRAMNFDPKNRPRRQDWAGELVENGMFYYSKREILEAGYFQGERSKYVEIPKNYSLQIDSIEDLHLAQTLLKSQRLK